MRAQRRRGWFLAAMVVVAAAWPGFAEEPRRIYIANDDHTDYVWTADEAEYRAAFLEMLDYYLDQADATAHLPADHQSRFNCDGHLWLRTYEQERSPEQFRRLIARIRDGHISVPLNVLAVCLGAAPAEAVIRGSYYPGLVERRYGVRFPLAYAMENQTLPYGLASLWAGCGARYSWRGVCGCATRLGDRVRAPRPHEIYRWVGPDGRGLLLKWHSLDRGNNQSIGGYAEARKPAEAVAFLDGDPAFRRRYPYRVLGAFGKGWDDLKTLTDEFVTTAAALSTPARRVIVSNEVDFFEDFERTHPDGLPEVAASHGNEWDLYCASMAEVTARVKRAVERLRGAEAMAAMASLAEPAVWSKLATGRDRAMLALGLYWEHDWTADSPSLPRSRRAEWQRGLAGEIEAYVDALHAAAADALGRQIRREGQGTAHFVFNPLGWTRTDVADLPLEGEGPAHAIDAASGAEIPSQVIATGAGRALRVLVADLPPVGYRCVRVRPGVGGTWPTAVEARGATLESETDRVVLDGRGAITSWIDKVAGGRERVRSHSGRTLNDLGPATGTVEVESVGPVSATLRAETDGPPRRTTRVTLYRGLRRIEVCNEIRETFEGVETWGFGFALEGAELRHEEVGAIVRARLVPEGGHYAPSHARYDWLTLNHFADLSGSDGGVTLSNADCAFLKYGASTPDRLDAGTPFFAVLAGGQVDGPKLGIPGQGGDRRFLQRFALRAHGGYDAAQAMRFALEHQNPPIVGRVEGGDRWPATRHSLLEGNDPAVLLWALKPAEEGIDAGLIVRLWNVSDADRPFRLALDRGIATARHASHIETDLEPATVVDGALSGRLAGRRMETYRLMPTSRD